MEKTDSHRLHATIEGLVQGVGFRYFVVDVAEELGICGWVRNCWDGKVEVTAEANRIALDKLLLALRQGPRGSRVTAVNYEWQTATGDFSNFRIKSTI